MLSSAAQAHVSLVKHSEQSSACSQATETVHVTSMVVRGLLAKS